MTRTVVNKTFSPGSSEDSIYERILAAIFEHRLPPGTKLGEDRLASI